MSSESKCPVMGGSHKNNAVGSFANQRWWPNQLNLKILHQNDPSSSPMDEDFDYAAAFNSLDHEALKADIMAVMTDSSRGGQRIMGTMARSLSAWPGTAQEPTGSMTVAAVRAPARCGLPR